VLRTLWRIDINNFEIDKLSRGYFKISCFIYKNLQILKPLNKRIPIKELVVEIHRMPFETTNSIFGTQKNCHSDLNVL